MGNGGSRQQWQDRARLRALRRAATLLGPRSGHIVGVCRDWREALCGADARRTLWTALVTTRHGACPPGSPLRAYAACVCIDSGSAQTLLVAGVHFVAKDYAIVEAAHPCVAALQGHYLGTRNVFVTRAAAVLEAAETLVAEARGNQRLHDACVAWCAASRPRRDDGRVHEMLAHIFSTALVMRNAAIDSSVTSEALHGASAQIVDDTSRLVWRAATLLRQVWVADEMLAALQCARFDHVNALANIAVVLRRAGLPTDFADVPTHPAPMTRAERDKCEQRLGVLLSSLFGGGGSDSDATATIGCAGRSDAGPLAQRDSAAAAAGVTAATV